ncbi:MAG: hypothetical protein D8H94_07075 [Cardiobacterium sp.]|nr:MAG: hypothetical protein D8H94_07075 [Cardiobacterium sp.]
MTPEMKETVFLEEVATTGYMAAIWVIIFMATAILTGVCQASVSTEMIKFMALAITTKLKEMVVMIPSSAMALLTSILWNM